MVTSRKHRHAALIKQWLDDGSLEVEIESCHYPYWEKEPYPDWNENLNYRFKPKMIRCGDMEFPEPMRVAYVDGAAYWIADPTRLSPTCELRWSNDYMDRVLLDRGLAHTTQAAAEAHARALIALTEGKS